MAKNLTTGLQRGLRQSIAGGLGTGDLFSTASLDLQFARHKSLDSRVTHTRQSSATYVDGDGVIRTAVTNLLLRSEEFDDADWTNNANVTPNTAVSPAGTTTADTLAISTPGQWLQQTVSIASGATLAFSVYAKELATAFTVIRVSNLTNTSYQNIWFDLNSGSVGTVGGTGSDVTSVVGSIEQSQNGFYRISIVVETSGITDVVTRIATVASDGSFTRSGSIYLWGAQLEQSSYPTSYIPTQGSTATRAADVSTSAATTVFESDWYRQDEGTVFADYDVGGGTQNRYSFAISDNTINNRIAAFNSGGSNLNFRIVNSGTSYNPGASTVNAVGASKICLAYATTTNGGAGVSNGTLASASSPAALPTVDRLYVGLSQSGAEPLNGPVRRLVFWPRRLPNEVLQTITL